MARTIREIVVLKNGSSINGEVLVKEFVLKLEVGTLKLKKADIISIAYKNPPSTTTDEVKVRGELTFAEIWAHQSSLSVSETLHKCCAFQTQTSIQSFYSSGGAGCQPQRGSCLSLSPAGEGILYTGKHLWLVVMLAFRETGQSMTGATYAALPQGAQLNNYRGLAKLLAGADPQMPSR